MQFLNASWLGPLLPLVALPPLIHWLSKRYPKKFAFSSIDEIRKTVAGRSRLFRWRHWLMLLLRTLALAALLIAFLRPLIAPRGTPTHDKRHVLLMVDHSLSMDCVESGATARTKARAEVKRLLDSLDADDRFNLIRVDNSPAAAFTSFSTDTKSALDFLDHSVAPFTPADFRSANLLAGELAKEVKQPPDVYYFSDFQRRDWADVNFDALPKGTRLFFISASDDTARGNRSIVSLELGQGAVISGGEVEVKARVANHSAAPWQGKIEAGFGPSGLRESEITLAPWAESDVSLVVPVPSGGLLQLTVSLPPDDLPADDRRRLVVKVREREEVVILTGDVKETTAATPSLFLTTAVDPFTGDKGLYKPKALSPQALTPAALAATTRVIATRLPALTDDMAGTLATFLRGGGGVVWFLDGEADATNLAKLATLSGEKMPLQLTEKLQTQHIAGGAMHVASGDFHSRFLRLFEGVRRQNLAALEFYDIYHAAATGSGKTLLTFADGTPALAESTVGLGTLLICNFSVAEASSNLAGQRLFPAWVQEMLLRLNPTGSAAMEPFLASDAVSGEAWTSEAAGRELLGPSGPQPARTDILGERTRFSFTAREPGFYRVAGANNANLLSFAVNTDPEQSDLRSIDPTVLPDRAGSSHPEAAYMGATTDYQMLLRGKPAFHWFLLGALGLLFIEGALFKSSSKRVSER